MLAACAVARTQAVTTPEVVQQSSQDRVTAQANVPPISGELTLNEAVARALKYNLDQRVSIAEQVIANHQFTVAQRELLPNIMATAGYNTRDTDMTRRSLDAVTGQPSNANPFISSERSHFTGELGVTWNLLDFGVGYYNARQAGNRIFIADERRRKAVHTLIQDVQTAFWRAYSAQVLRGQILETIELAESALVDAKQAEAERLRSPLDSLRFQRQILENLRTLEALDQELSTAKLDLARLINVPMTTEFSLAEPQTDFPDELLDAPVDQLEELAIIGSADIREQQYNARNARIEARKTLLRMFPRLTLDYGYNYDSDKFLINNTLNDAGAQIAYSLLNIANLPLNRRLAEAGVELADQRRVATLMAVISQVHISRQQYANSRALYERADQLADAEQRILAQMAAREQAAVQSKLETVSSRTSLIISLLRRYQTLAQVYASQSRLQATMGVDPGIARVDDMSLPQLTTAIGQSFQRWRASLSAPVPPPPPPPPPRYGATPLPGVLPPQTDTEIAELPGQPITPPSVRPPATPNPYPEGPAPTTGYDVSIGLQDTDVNDSFSPIDGALTASDVDAGAALVYTLAGSAPDKGLPGFTVSRASPFGRMYLNSATGQYRFVPNNGAINNVPGGANPYADFTFAVSDRDSSVGQTLRINVSGANDTPALNNPSDFGYTDTVASDSFTAVEGALTSGDVDAGASRTYGLTGAVGDSRMTGFNVSRTSPYGTMYLNTASGQYRFVPDSSAINALPQGNDPIASFAFTVTDERGASDGESLDVRIRGADDAPVLAQPGHIALRDTAGTEAYPPVTGTLSADDVDTGDTKVYGLAGATADNAIGNYNASRATTYGVMYLNTATGAYRFVPNAVAIKALPAGANPTTDFNFTVTDAAGVSHARTLTVSIAGAGDAPVLAAPQDISLVDTPAADTYANVSGALAARNIDAGARLTFGLGGSTSDRSLAGFDVARRTTHGTMFLNTTSGAYRFVPNAAAINALRAGERPTESFLFSVSDGQMSATQTLDVDITGANDLAVLAEPADITIRETEVGDAFPPVEGRLSSGDRDAGAALTYTMTGALADATISGFNVSRSATYGVMYLNTTTGAYRFVANPSAINALPAGANPVMSFGFTVSDGALTSSQTLDIVVIGANDRPRLNKPSDIALADTPARDTFPPVSGLLAGDDYDTGATLSFSLAESVADNSAPGYNVSRTTAYGTIYLSTDNGAYLFVPNSAAINGLSAGANPTVTFTFTVTDGSLSSSQTLVVNITGANDTPTLTVPGAAIARPGS
ncbi:MAG TPA: VCBS domain-containing protein [Caulobacteraceae bacterium]|nr:VCBS domain-containing protein [Caulobacteraceae bacterium]